MRKKWAGRVRLLPTLVSLAFLAVLVVSAGLSRGLPFSPRAEADQSVHTVALGDTVAKIAQQYGTSVDAITSANNLPNADVIYPGQDLKVETAPSPVADRKHVVQAGDTVWSIAEQYGITADAVLNRNALPNGDLIAIGQEIVIPGPEARGPGASARSAPREDPLGRLWSPYRTQLDGSPSSGSNCGPATLGMAMSYFGEWWTTAGIRKSVNEYQGTWDVDAGSTWEAMAYAARKRGFQVIGITDGAGNYRQWSIEDLVAETKKGHAVVVMTRYWSLPGHDDSTWWGDHYILFLGLTPGGDIIYHDSAFATESEGAYRTMTKDRFIRAWSRTAAGQNYTAMALAWPGSH
ncbi:MAG: LysM peptidoglycan-binding domain-containing protein [Chloroflexota bacterium]